MAHVVVYHSYYGCETGCCGHTVALTRDDGSESERFQFDHPYYVSSASASKMAGISEPNPELLKWAQEMVRKEYGEEHVADLDWTQCEIVDD